MSLNQILHGTIRPLDIKVQTIDVVDAVTTNNLEVKGDLTVLGMTDIADGVADNFTADNVTCISTVMTSALSVTDDCISFAPVQISVNGPQLILGEASNPLSLLAEDGEMKEVISFPRLGLNSNVVLSEGDQKINGNKIFTSGVYTSELILSESPGTDTHRIYIDVPVVTANVNLFIPVIGNGTDADFMLTTPISCCPHVVLHLNSQDRLLTLLTMGPLVRYLPKLLVPSPGAQHPFSFTIASLPLTR